MNLSTSLPGELPFDTILPLDSAETTLDLRDTINRVFALDTEPRDHGITREGVALPESHLDAVSVAAACKPTLAESSGGSCIEERLHEPQLLMQEPPMQEPPSRPTGFIGGPERPRDESMLLHAVQFRLASFRQLHDVVFADQHFSTVGRRAEVLVKLGLATVWEDRLPIGGHPRYLIPTERGIVWAQRELAARVQELPQAVLVRQMLHGASRKPLHIAPGTAPLWLPHQRETNALVARFLGAPTLRVRWASTWHRPFPNAVDGLAMPQPDFVLVLERGDAATLVFGEHDRGHEPVAAFKRAKAERYAALARFPDLLARLTGFGAFEVWTTVEDAQPVDRIGELLDAARKTYGAPLMRFTPAQWARTEPEGAIWFDAAHRPEHSQPQREAHRNLQRAFNADAAAAIVRHTP